MIKMNSQYSSTCVLCLTDQTLDERDVNVSELLDFQSHQHLSVFAHIHALICVQLRRIGDISNQFQILSFDGMVITYYQLYVHIPLKPLLVLDSCVLTFDRYISNYIVDIQLHKFPIWHRSGICLLNCRFCFSISQL